MRTFHSSQSVHWIARFLLAVAVFIAAETQAQLFHGASIQKNPVGPTGLPKAHVGEIITAAIRVRNIDDFSDSLTITSIVDVVHHGTGDMVSANLLLTPRTLVGFGDSVTVTNTYPVLPGDPDVLTDDAQAGGIDNHDGDGGIKQDFFITFPGQVRIVRPCIDVSKSCSNGVGEGGLITYVGTVANCGNGVLTNVVVSNLVNGALSRVFGPVTLNIGQSVSFTNSYVGGCAPTTDTLLAYGTDELALRVSDSATATCSNIMTAGISVTKNCPANSVAPGTLLTFTGVVSNTGNVTITNVVVVNNQPVPGTVVFGPINLGPGQFARFTNGYVVPSDTCGPWADTLTATARSICGSNVTASATAVCPFTTNPRISITKFCPPNPTPAGTLLVYSGVVSNSGNVTLTNVFVVDDKPTNNTPVLGPITLAPGQFARFTNSYLVPGEDCCGPYVDMLTASGRDRCTGSNVVKTATAVCPALTSPALCITRTCPPGPITIGQPLTFSGIVSNCGNVALSNVVVLDNNGNVIMAMQGFSIGEWMDYSSTFTPGNCGPNVTNIITITGRDICSGALVSSSAACILDCAGGQLVILSPALTVTKMGFWFQSLPNKTYTVQYIDSLSPPTSNWQTLSNVNGSGSVLYIEDSLSQTQRYYRVLQNP